MAKANDANEAVRPARHRAGCFIVLEGIDGSGTTTQLARLGEALRARGFDVVTTAEPSRGPIGLFLREILGRRCLVDGAPHSFDWLSMALLFAADRADHVATVIRPALERGAIVVSDRYDLSSLVYQSATSPEGAASLDWLRALNAKAPRPDLTLVLDVPVDVARARRSARGAARELYEDDALQARLTTLYASAAELIAEDRVVMVPGDGDVGAVTERILGAVARELESEHSDSA